MSPAAIAGHASSARAIAPSICRLVFRARRLQHVVGDFLLREFRLARVSDADAQPPVLRGAQLRLDVAQSVVAGVSAAELHLRLAGLQVELVVHDEDLLRRDREEARDRRDGAAGEVHERRGLHDPHVARLRDVRRELALRRERGRELPRQRVGEPEARVVAGARVFAARVSQTGDEANGHGHDGRRGARKRKRPALFLRASLRDAAFAAALTSSCRPSCRC